MIIDYDDTFNEPEVCCAWADKTDSEHTKVWVVLRCTTPSNQYVGYIEGVFTDEKAARQFLFNRAAGGNGAYAVEEWEANAKQTNWNTPLDKEEVA
jgi:hypothetical protein